MTNISIYDTEATIIEKIADRKDMTEAEVIEEILEAYLETFPEERP